MYLSNTGSNFKVNMANIGKLRLSNKVIIKIYKDSNLYKRFPAS